MENEKMKKGISEVLEILDFMEDTYVKKIPEKFMEYLQKNKADNYESKIDHTKPFKDSEISDEAKNILATIYLNYWCDEKEKEEYKKTLKENEQKYYNEMKEKYNPNEIFKNKEKVNNVQIQTENTAMIEYKETFFKNIINKIKKFFKK